VAITILGIIMIAIGTMITTSFRTSTMVSAELQGSRGPKVVSRYWVPDVEQAEVVTPNTGGCGAGDSPVATLSSKTGVSAFEHPDQADVAMPRTITWWQVRNGNRDQLVRRVCDGAAAIVTLVVVSDLKNKPGVSDAGAGRSTISVTVPDRSRAHDEYSFDVTGQSQITPVSAP
jgi:hypothetical protein